MPRHPIDWKKKGILTPNVAGSLIDVSGPSVRRMIRIGQLPAHKGGTRDQRIYAVDLLRYVYHENMTVKEELLIATINQLKPINPEASELLRKYMEDVARPLYDEHGKLLPTIPKPPPIREVLRDLFTNHINPSGKPQFDDKGMAI